MVDKTKAKAAGTRMMDNLLRGQKAGKTNDEIFGGLKAGLASDYMSLDEGLRRGATVVDPAKYTRAMDGRDEKPRKPQRLERDIIGRIERAKQEIAAETASPEYREKVIRQKRAMIHKVMTQRGTDELTANIRGYDVTLLRLPETGQDGMRKIKMFVGGQEIPDRQFDDALAEVAGLNDSQAFNMAAEIGKEFRDQAGIQGARTVTQVGLNAVGAPVRAVKNSGAKNQQLLGQLLGMLFRLVITTARSR